MLVLAFVLIVSGTGSPNPAPTPDPPLWAAMLIVIVFGLAAGCVAGAVQFLAGWVFRRRERPAVAAPEPVAIASVDPWAEPVDRSKQSAKAVTRLLESLPATAAGDWLGRIAETMSANLADIESLAEAGRAALPATDGRAVAEIKRHPLYGLLQQSAGEFADVVDQINRMTVELHTPRGLEQVRTQLQVLAEQMPLLRRTP